VWRNPILKNKILVYSIIISLALHIITFFVLGKLSYLKENKLAKISKTKTIFVTFNDSNLNKHKNPLLHNIIEKNKKDYRINKRVKSEHQRINKDTMVDESKDPDKIANISLVRVPNRIVEDKISKIERSEKTISLTNNLSNTTNSYNLVSDFNANRDEIRIIPPDYKINKKPVYPRLARIKGYQGTVYLKITIDSNGRVIDSVVEKSSGYSMLDKSALKASYNWRFKPTYINGNATGTTILVPVTFKLTKDS